MFENPKQMNELEKTNLTPSLNCLKITQNVVFECFSLCHFPTIFTLSKLKSDLSGNTVSPQASGFQWTIFGIFNELLSS